MDPATVALAIKALDVAFIVGTYYMRRAESHQELDEMVTIVDEVRRVKASLEDGTLTPDEAKVRMQALQATALRPLREAIDRL